MALRLASQEAGIQRVIAAGFPTRIAERDFAYQVRVPKYFVQSTHDEFGPRPELKEFFESLPEPRHLNGLEASDHFFADALDSFEIIVEGDRASQERLNECCPIRRTGKTGSRILRELLSRGHQVKAVVRIRQSWSSQRTHIEQGDLDDAGRDCKYDKGAEAVVSASSADDGGRGTGFGHRAIDCGRAAVVRSSITYCGRRRQVSRSSLACNSSIAILFRKLETDCPRARRGFAETESVCYQLDLSQPLGFLGAR